MRRTTRSGSLELLLDEAVEPVVPVVDEAPMFVLLFAVVPVAPDVVEPVVAGALTLLLALLALRLSMALACWADANSSELNGMATSFSPIPRKPPTPTTAATA